MTFNLTIQDVQGAKYFAPDVVPQAVSNAYNSELQQFLSIYNSFITGQINLDSTNAQQVYNQLLTAKDTLINYASNGIPLPGVGNTATTGYLNQNMARSLDTLFKTLDIAGITDGSTTDPLTAVQNWLDLSTAGLGDYLSQAAQAGQTGRSIQAMIELEYIKAGNDLITQQLGNLESALNLTQQATVLLTSIQNLHNKVAPNSAPSGVFSTSTNADTYINQFQSYGTTAYNNPIGVHASVFGADYTHYLNITNSVNGSLVTLISNLLAVTFPNAGGIQGAFSSMTGQPINSALNGSLAASLYQVYHDMTQPTGSQGDKLKNWIVDNMGNATTQGNYATDLTTAETSAQSLNDQQKQNIQQTLFLFQEFYQSGSGMLTQINQIIQAMAQGAGQ